jgi:hypothetical protein
VNLDKHRQRLKKTHISPWLMNTDNTALQLQKKPPYS